MSESDFYQLIAQEMNLRAIQVAHTVELLDEGNTVPFIARYRKEATGKLDEEQIRTIEERIKYVRALEDRKQTILKSIEEQGKLTPELEAKIKATTKLQELEDLYLPYRPKKRTRATVARERGLEPLAELILKQEMESNINRIDFNLRMVDSEYRCSMAVENFRPDYVIIDCSIGKNECAGYTRHLSEDPRIPYVKIILVGDIHEIPSECNRLIFAVMNDPFNLAELENLIGLAKIGREADKQ